jgi:hypothetical protein
MPADRGEDIGIDLALLDTDSVVKKTEKIIKNYTFYQITYLLVLFNNAITKK